MSTRLRKKSDLQSVDHVTAALEVLATSRSPLSLKAAVERIGLPQTTVFRLLTSLEQQGFARRDTETGGYLLGPKSFTLAERYLAQLDVRSAARPALEWLWNATRFTVHFSVLDRTDAIYIDKIDGTQPIQAHTYIGGRAPAYAVSAGLAQLAFLDDAAVRRHLPDQLTKHTAATVDDLDLLFERLKDIRAQGCAINTGGWRAVIGGISAPVFQYDGRPVGSLGVVLPSSEMGEEVMTETVPKVVQAAALASQKLGHSSEPADVLEHR